MAKEKNLYVLYATSDTPLISSPPPHLLIPSISDSIRKTLIAVLAVLFVISFYYMTFNTGSVVVDSTCRLSLVETIPQNLTFTSETFKHDSTFDTWKKLITLAEDKIDLAVFYWSLKNGDVSPEYFPSSLPGEQIFQKLMDAGISRDIKITIAQNAPNEESPQTESKTLMTRANAHVYNLDFEKLIGGGVLHTKMWIVDDKHFYLGSANMDWRSLTQVKELGYFGENCPMIAQDLQKIFKTYVYIAKQKTLPNSFPDDLYTEYNTKNPMKLSVNSLPATSFLSSSPPSFIPGKRANDIDAIVEHINQADQFVYIAVMDYFPSSLYTKDKSYWPVIDGALRKAAYERHVDVRVLGSHWNHTRPAMARWLQSLQDISSENVRLETRLFVVPSFTEEQREIPFGRVNHNKYMVTDKTAYIGTSNWSEDYFVDTGGIGVSVTPSEDFGGEGASIRLQLQLIHERDWTSPYAKPVSQFV